MTTEACCVSHVPAVLSRVGWCASAQFDGCDPCCDRCPDWPGWHWIDKDEDDAAE